MYLMLILCGSLACLGVRVSYSSHALIKWPEHAQCFARAKVSQIRRWFLKQFFSEQGLLSLSIQKELNKEGIKASVVGI